MEKMWLAVLNDPRLDLMLPCEVFDDFARYPACNLGKEEHCMFCRRHGFSCGCLEDYHPDDYDADFSALPSGCWDGCGLNQVLMFHSLISGLVAGHPAMQCRFPNTFPLNHCEKHMNDTIAFSFNEQNLHAVWSGLAIDTPVKMMLIGDPHITETDSRDNLYAQNFRRMAQWGKDSLTQFRTALEKAAAQKVDAVLLPGDVVSFPSLKGIEDAVTALKATGIPWVYTAGNHDWHFEGLSGSEMELRASWSSRTAPLYNGAPPLVSCHDFGGIRIIAVDNSTYEILPEQLESLRGLLSEGYPSFLLVHVPLYVPGRNIFFGCGHPEWNAASDPYWQIEQRERWPESGHSPTTYAFHREVFANKNLIGILAGHIHAVSVDSFKGRIQLVAAKADRPIELEFLP